ncbi:DDE Tnp 1-like zinc-ribbon [Popillia japonica]|uniref:DDE Tnp 1-like zinc-ribbon n=1 Tax=Popillia japonica TaxID=7064 RepID=A0AAW1HFI0_POPJA
MLSNHDEPSLTHAALGNLSPICLLNAPAVLVWETVIIKNPNKLTQTELEELAQVICDSDSEDEIPDDDAHTCSDEYIEKSEHDVEKSEHDSDSEIDGNDSGDFDEEDENSNHFIGEHDSDSEIDGNDSGDFDEEDENSNHFIAKDRLTTWHKNSLKSKFSKLTSTEELLSLALMKPYLAERASMELLPNDIKYFLTKYKKPEESVEEEPSAKIRARCFICGRKKNRVTTIICDSCKKSVCKQHMTTGCNVRFMQEW